MFSPGIEPGTFCVLDRCDNRYTTKTCYEVYVNYCRNLILQFFVNFLSNGSKIQFSFITLDWLVSPFHPVHFSLMINWFLMRFRTAFIVFILCQIMMTRPTDPHRAIINTICSESNIIQFDLWRKKSKATSKPKAS